MVVKNPKTGATFTLSNQTQIDAFLAAGWAPVEDGGSGPQAEREPSGADYSGMSDEDLAALATEKGIVAEGKTRRQMINALKKAV